MTQSEKQSVPKLRFPDFDGGWRPRALRAFVDPQRKITYGIVQPGEFVAEGVPLVRGGDYSDGWVPFDHIKRVTPKIDAPYKRSKLKADDLLMTIVGANTGTIAKVPDWLNGANITQTTARIAVDRESADTGFILQCLQSDIGQNEVRKYIKGAAQPGLNLSDVERFRVPAPSLPEQRKIASFLGAVDTKIAQLAEKKRLLENYKKGCVQQLFSQKIRFHDDTGNEFPDWEEKPLHSFLTETKAKSDGTEAVFSVSVHKGLINQVEHLGRSFSAADTSHYNRVDPGDIVYTKSPTGDFPFGIIKQSRLDTSLIVSPLYGVFRPETPWLGYWLHVYFESSIYTGNYLKPIIQKGAKNTINITNKTFLSAKLKVSTHPEEQRKIADFLSALDRKINLVGQELDHARSFKQGLLQQMFV